MTRSRRDYLRRRRMCCYHILCWGAPLVFWLVSIMSYDVCTDVKGLDLQQAMQAFHPWLLLVPEVLTMVISLAFGVINWYLAQECIQLLGVGTMGASIDGNNFSNWSIFCGMMMIFGCTRLT